jgi:Fe-S-cluster-containing hydrogenase component 2
MAEKQKEKVGVDIFKVLLEASKEKKKARREELLKSISVKDFFEEGNIKIDMKTCKGVECQFCIKVCPTKALYWKTGEIGVTEDLCVYCASCVLNCMVDNCIEVRRKRKDGTNERFSNPLDVFMMLNNINTLNRIKATKSILPDDETYLRRYRKPVSEREEEEK